MNDENFELGKNGDYCIRCKKLRVLLIFGKNFSKNYLDFLINFDISGGGNNFVIVMN